MRTVTIREAQHHLSKLVDEARESGQEIMLTRRSEEVCKITPITPPGEEKVDWQGWLVERKEAVKGMRRIEGSAIDIEREGCRW